MAHARLGRQTMKCVLQKLADCPLMREKDCMNCFAIVGSLDELELRYRDCAVYCDSDSTAKHLMNVYRQIRKEIDAA